MNQSILRKKPKKFWDAAKTLKHLKKCWGLYESA